MSSVCPFQQQRLFARDEDDIRSVSRRPARIQSGGEIEFSRWQSSDAPRHSSDRLELLRFRHVVQTGLAGITVMSRAAKAFLATSLVVTGVTVWGVHFIQAREEEVSPDRSILLLPNADLWWEGNVPGRRQG